MPYNKYQEETDLAALPGVLGLELKRYYNSQSSHPGLLGANWRMSYETVLYDFGSQIQIVQADGRRLMFQRGLGQNAALCSSAQPQDGQVRIEAAKDGRGPPTYHWRWADGRTLSFSGGSGGGYPLQSITAATGERLTLSYSPTGELTTIRDPQGRRLDLVYASAAEAAAQKRSRALKAIDTPLGRLTYSQDRLGRLTEVGQAKDAASAPFVTRLYHFEDRYNAGIKASLTGISVKGIDPQTNTSVEQRLSTYAYNAQGQAILSTKGRPREMKDGKQVADTGIEQVEVQYSEKALPREGKLDRTSGEIVPSQLGKAILTNSLGQKTQITSAVIGGHFRLIEMRGPGCSTCGPSDMRYAYDKAGLLLRSTKLDDQGKPIRNEITELDRYGRTARVGVQSYLNDKAQATRWIERYEYADRRYPDGSIAVAPQPSLIAKPSVVAGKEHTLAFVYNQFGQLAQVTEAGFSPVDDSGKPSPAGTLLTRSTTYRYRSLEGKSVLAEIDGPLANGPKGTPEDSDITRVTWDSGGAQIVAIDDPSRLESRIEYDPAGRLQRVTHSTGQADSYAYDSTGRLELLTHARGGRVVDGIAYKFDILGRATERLTVQAGGKQQPQSAQGFDVADRLLWHADHRGILQQATYDAEGHLLTSKVQGAGILQEERYAYDSLSRLAGVEDNTGARRRIVRNAEGRITGTVDPLGRLATPDPADRPRSFKLRDDFGRVVVTVSPDSGTSLHRFDEADRLVAGSDAQGNAATYEYDAAGHIVRQRITDQRTGQTTETRWRYAGNRLVALEHPTQSERYEHDERGLLVAKVVTQRQEGGGEWTSVTRYGWDESGVLQSVSLADGSRVRYQRNGQGQIVALQRSRIQTAWLQWLLPTKPLVNDLQRDLVGIKSYSAGNGIDASLQRSREGTLARIVYRNTRQATRSVTALRIEDMLGIASAQAAQAPASSPAPSAPTTPVSENAQLPGALGLPADPQAFIDHRYLWDAEGNLLYSQAKDGQAEDSSSAYAYDARDRLIAQSSGATTSRSFSRYHYDAAGRRVLSQEGIVQQDDLQTNTRKVQFQEGTHRWLGDSGQAISYDAGGQPDRIGQREYVWDATGRLIEVRQEDRTLALYRYSHRGERIGKTVGSERSSYLYDNRQLSAELGARGNITRQYVYLGDQPIAVIDTPEGHSLAAEEASTWQRVARDLRIAVSAWFSSDEHVAWLHANHLGAVEAATNEQGRIVWQASYAPFGAARVGKGGSKGDSSKSGFVLNVRLPGQYLDAETGLHYNQQRYYDPARGEYLTPDPLGTPDGPNGYAYARYNPLRYVDPQGLVLFAFDGTENSNPVLNPGSDTLSNVVEFRNKYESDSRIRYISGVGTVDVSDPARPIGAPLLDAGVNRSGPERIDRMVEYFNDEAGGIDDYTVMDVDIIGFSRGAAQARDFANRLASKTKNGWYSYTTKGQDGADVARCQLVGFRFLGLWDTVLSNNWSGYSYNLAIPASFSYVAQAVALNEYRDHTLPLGRANVSDTHSWGGFPLESIMGGAVPAAQTRIELGFIGSHSDIGGGFEDNELSKVALAWMIEQAEHAGIKMGTTPISVSANPVLHDKSDAIRFGSPTAGSPLVHDGPWNPNYDIPGNAVIGTGAEDRLVRYQDGTSTRQRDVTTARMRYADTEQFITFDAQRSRTDNITGTVDMDAYRAWLLLNGYDLKYLSVN